LEIENAKKRAVPNRVGHSYNMGSAQFRTQGLGFRVEDFLRVFQTFFDVFSNVVCIAITFFYWF
jgi:hypothetical protein